MPPTAYFLPAFELDVHSSDLCPNFTPPSKKRRRNSEAENDQLDLFNLSRETPGTSGPSSASRIECRDHDSAARDEAKDWVGDHESESGSFPVARVITEFATLESTLSQPTNERTMVSTIGLRHQHLVALVAVMHRSILERDFLRAGRAWGVILRAERGGHSFDLRTGNRWGVGADLHLQSHHPVGASSLAPWSQIVHTDHIAHTTKSTFSPEDFADAKDIYERLILQYPYRKAFPNNVGPLQFYPAMFGLWISSIVDQRLLKERALEATHLERLGKDDIFFPRITEKGHNQQQIRETTLAQADELACRLDNVVSSPPYSDTKVFWKLKGMVLLWIADLLMESSPRRLSQLPGKKYHQMTKEDWDYLEANTTGVNDDKSNDLSKAGKALLRARDAFQRALLCSEPIPPTGIR